MATDARSGPAVQHTPANVTRPDDFLAPVLRLQAFAPPGQRLRAGIDTVLVSRLQESLDHFGERFLHRLFTDAEQAAAGGAPERLAARFAAKEATLKAFGWHDTGIDWREIEVHTTAQGAPQLRLHGKAAACARADAIHEMAVSLSHDGDHACAIVVALAVQPAPLHSPTVRLNA